MEAKMMFGSDIWYIHANFVGAVNDISGNWANVTTNSDPSTYPQGIASYNLQTQLMSFEVISVPQLTTTTAGAGGAGANHNAHAGDLIQCYPFSKKAFWSSGSSYYDAGNCKLTSGGKVTLGPGYFDKSWAAGQDGINGAPLPSCAGTTLDFESDTTIVTPVNVLYVVELDCPSIKSYQVGGVLWFSDGAWEDVGSTEGKEATSIVPLPPLTPDVSSGCSHFDITVPTSRGTINASVKFYPYFYSGCTFQDGWLGGSIAINDTSYPILGIHMEFRCEPNYC
jgi:hypothetical protein